MRLNEIEKFQKRIIKLWSRRIGSGDIELWAKPARINNNQNDILIMVGDADDIEQRKDQIQNGNDPEYVIVVDNPPIRMYKHPKKK